LWPAEDFGILFIHSQIGVKIQKKLILELVTTIKPQIGSFSIATTHKWLQLASTRWHRGSNGTRNKMVSSG
jgi:hypothetical protein